MATKKIKLLDNYCVYCGREHAVEDFYKSFNPYHTSGYIPYCKESARKIYDNYLVKTGNVESALWYTCSEIGIPFITKVYKAVLERVKNLGPGKDYNYIGIYITFLHRLKTKVDKWDTFYRTDVSLDQVSSVSKSEEAINKEAQRLELDWGKQTVEDYQFLEYRWDVYMERFKDVEVPPAQETLYRQLCLVELRKRKKEEKEELTDKEQSMILNLMKILKIDNFSNNDEKTLVESLLERQIWEQENTDPCEIVDKEKYRDYCDIEKKWGKNVLRAVKNLLVGNREYPSITEMEDEKQ